MKRLNKYYLFILISMVAATTYAGPVPLQKVNDYILKTHKILELQRDKVILDNELSATPPRAAATFIERNVNSTFGVEMKMMAPMPDIQESGSYIPTSSDSLIEQQLLERQNEGLSTNPPLNR